MEVGGLIALLTALIGFVLYVMKRWDEKKEANAPEKRQQETDADLVNPDPVPLAVRLSKLVDKIRARRGAPK